MPEVGRGLGQRSEELLGRVHNSRAFTYHQLEALITGRLEEALRRFDSRSLLLAGLLDTLYDEDVSHGEARPPIYGFSMGALTRLPHSVQEPS